VNTFAFPLRGSRIQSPPGALRRAWVSSSAPALFPLLASGTLLFVVWVAALTVALLRSTRTESRVAPRVDRAGRISGAPGEM
jgi:hypothetical protein